MRKILPCIFAVLILSFAFFSCNPNEWPESDEPGANADVKYTIKGSISLTGDDSFKAGDTISILEVPEALKKKNPKDFTIALKKDENDDNWTVEGSFTVASGTKLSDVTSLEWGGGFSGQPSGIEITKLTLNGKGDDTQHTYTINSGTIEVRKADVPPQEVTVKLTGTPNITGTNIDNIQDGDVITITTNPTTGLDNVTSTSVNITKEAGGTWKVEGEIKLKLPAGEVFTGEKTLSWPELSGVEASESKVTVSAVTLTGTVSDSDSQYALNATEGTITVEDSVVPQPQVVTVNFSGTPSLEIRNGELKDNDVITLEAPPDGLSNASDVHVAVSKELGSWKVYGEFTLPSGTEFTQSSLTWSNLINNSVNSGATINSVTLTASSIGGSASEGYTFVATGGSVDITPAVPIDEHAVVVTILGSLVTITSESEGDGLIVDDEFDIIDAPEEFKDSATSADVDFKKSTDDGRWEVNGTIILNPGTAVTTKTLTWRTPNVKGSISDTIVNEVTLNGTVVKASDYSYSFEIDSTGGTINAGESDLVRLNISGDSVQYSGTESLLNGDIIDLTVNPNGDGDSLEDISKSTRIKLETKDSSQKTESVSGYIMLSAGTEISSISSVKTISWDMSNDPIDPSSESWLEVTSVTLTGNVDVGSSTFTVESVTITTGDSLGKKGEVSIEFPQDGLAFTTTPGSIPAEELYDFFNGKELRLTTKIVHGGSGEFVKGGAISELNLYLTVGENGKVSLDLDNEKHSFTLNSGYTGIIRDTIPLAGKEFGRLKTTDINLKELKLGHIHGIYLHGHQKLNKWIVDGIKFDIPKLVQIGDNELELSKTSAIVDSGTASPSSGEKLEVDLTGHVSDGSAIGTVTITFSSPTSVTVASNDLAVSNLKLGNGTVEIEASNQGGWSLGDASIEKVKLSGTYESNNKMTLTISNIALTPKASE